MQASDLKAGDKVFYLDDIPAAVVSVDKNGVRIGFWFGARHGLPDKWIVRRVAVRTLAPRAHPALTA